jgi:hypothetical protein
MGDFMTNSEYYGFTNEGKFTKHLEQLTTPIEEMNAVDFIHWLQKEKQPNLTVKEKMFLTDFVNTYAGLVNIQTVTRIYDRKRNAYFLCFQSANGLDLTSTFSCFNEMSFNNLEEYKAYNIRELLGKD